MFRSAFARAAAAVVGVIVVACSEQSVTAPATPKTLGASRSITSSSAVWTQQIAGTTADGAEYAIFVPTGWNGDVVFYAHGIVPPQAPVILPQPGQDWDNAGDIRDALGMAGYAVAYSTFGENGYAIKEGIQRTHQLRGIFNSKVGKPRRAFLMGHSLGSQVAQALAEKYPAQYNGAFLMCGVLGGTKLQTDYIGDVRTLFDFFYPGVLPGNTMDMPANVDLVNDIQLPALGAIQRNPAPLGLIAAANQVQLAGGNDPTLLITTLLNALSYHALGVNDLLSRTHGHILFDNSATVYTSDVLPPQYAPYYDAINQGIARFAATPDAAAWLEHNYEPTGDLQIPMLTLHKTQDRLVPYRHEAAYRARVQAAGAGVNLVQRSVNQYGHCEFPVSDVMSNFQDLVRWVDGGVQP
jgi:pimeloyl-ACP methyl ester carboxylesterase